MHTGILQPDCAKCCGLCCVAPAFDADQGFGFDKPAHEPCRNLREDFKCTIHGNLVESGFRGCQVFDCHGAGQRTTQHLFQGASWRESPDLAQRMFAAYSRMRTLHEQLVLLNAAHSKFSQGPVHNEIESRLRKLEQTCQLNEADFAGANIDDIKRENLKFIHGLRHAELNADESRVAPFVRDFEAGLIPKYLWTHRAHLIAGFWYQTRHPTDSLDRMRTGIRHHNEAVGTLNSSSSGYHESITRLYLAAIRAHIGQYPAMSFADSLAKLLDSPVADSQWPLQHYSAGRLFSAAARLQWVEPDLLPCPGATAPEDRNPT
jgi:hypothetical protein